MTCKTLWLSQFLAKDNLPMGLLSCTASFQRLMETVLLNIKNILVYIDNLLIHIATYEDHLKVLGKVFK
jgi:hypothetical protein